MVITFTDWYVEEYLYTAELDPALRYLNQAGGHCNPMGVNHGLPNEIFHHYGNDGNILVD